MPIVVISRCATLRLRPCRLRCVAAETVFENLRVYHNRLFERHSQRRSPCVTQTSTSDHRRATDGLQWGQASGRFSWLRRGYSRRRPRSHRDFVLSVGFALVAFVSGLGLSSSLIYCPTGFTPGGVFICEWSWSGARSWRGLDSGEPCRHPNRELMASPLNSGHVGDDLGRIAVHQLTKPRKAAQKSSGFALTRQRRPTRGSRPDLYLSQLGRPLIDNPRVFDFVLS